MAKRLLNYIKPWKAHYIIAILCLILSSVVRLIMPDITSQAISAISENIADKKFLINIFIILVVLYLLRSVFRYFTSYYSHYAAWNAVPRLRVEVFDRLQILGVSYLKDKQTGQLMSRVMQDTDKVEVLLAHAFPDFLVNILAIVGVCVILLYKNVQLALITFIPIPVLLFSGWIYVKKLRPMFLEANQINAEFNAILQDSIIGIKEILAFGQQEREHLRLKDRGKAFTKANLKALRRLAFFYPTVEFVISMGTAVVLLFGGMKVLNMTMDPGEIVGFILYLNLLYEPASTLARMMEDLQSGFAGVSRAFEILDAQPDITDADDAIAPTERINGKIDFKNVDFGYDKEMKILDDVSFSVKPGEMLAIVGPTGVGKTTIINLIERFYDPDSGEITLDDYNLKDVKLEWLRKQISIVLQDVILINGTIAENIAYSNPNADLTDIINAAKVACAHEFIEQMPNGYDTMVGERGMLLSGGQKQRLSIARAILRQSPVLVLDEATASIDAETESRIQQAISNLQGTQTIIVIAHRLSTIVQADRILVLSDGKIVEQGNHKELMNNKDGIYAKMIGLQTAF